MSAQRPSVKLKTVYCLVLIAAMLPFGLADTGWVGMLIGALGLGLVPAIGPLLFCALSLYRIYLVVRVPGVLDAPQSKGFVTLLRRVGIVFLYVGAFSAVLSWVAAPLIKAFMGNGAQGGAQFLLEFYLYMAAGVGVTGVALFEFSRLLAFERAAR